jgi:hypothetical protein
MDQMLCTISKIGEQIERTDHLIGLLPDSQLDWRPAIPGAFSTGVLLGHLLECLAGFCAVLFAAEPDRLHHFVDLRQLVVNHRCDRIEAQERIRVYGAHIQQGFTLLQDSDLGKLVPTVFVNDGEALLMLLLGNLEHFVNHKHQLFAYLQLMGIDVGSKDLYHFRGE